MGALGDEAGCGLDILQTDIGAGSDVDDDAMGTRNAGLQQRGGNGGLGSAKGAGKAENAAKAAISSPLLETSIAGAHGVIINITSSPDIGLEDVETAAGLITQSAHPDANIIWGTAFDENLSDEMRVTVVATGFDNKSASDLRNSINNAMGGAQSTPSAVFSSETASPAPAAQTDAAASAAAKPVEEDNSDNGYYDQLMAMLNKRR